VRFDDDDDKPKFSFRPKWKHLFYLLDLAIIAGLFYAGAWGYRTWVGEKKLAEQVQIRQQTQVDATQLLAQADSVLRAEMGRLNGAMADSAARADELLARRATLLNLVAEQERVNQGTGPLAEEVFDRQYKATKAVEDVRDNKEELAAKRAQLAQLQADAERAALELEEALRRQEDATSRLANARSLRAVEPVGIFPDKSGLAVRQDISDTQELTNVEFRRSFWKHGFADVGLHLALGIGSKEVTSGKEVGLVLSRPLIHRRLGLDLTAGYSVLSGMEGYDGSSMYAAAGLRLSPFYKERFHLGLGARAAEEEVTPYLSIGVGR
jgi:hypothetical protein